MPTDSTLRYSLLTYCIRIFKNTFICTVFVDKMISMNTVLMLLVVCYRYSTSVTHLDSVAGNVSTVCMLSAVLRPPHLSMSE